jgi:nitrogenase molybdenum-iron protein alpha/beta subunit
LNRTAWKLTFTLFRAGEFVVSRGFRAVSHVPGYDALIDTLLDTLLGPEDDFDYVSTTTPVAPPPGHAQ